MTLEEKEKEINNQIESIRKSRVDLSQLYDEYHILKEKESSKKTLSQRYPSCGIIFTTISFSVRIVTDEMDTESTLRFLLRYKNIIHQYMLYTDNGGNEFDKDGNQISELIVL